MPKKLWLGIPLLVLAVFSLASYVVLTFDPLGWGQAKSDNFSWERFSRVRAGEPIDLVINRLGAPIRPAEPLTILTTDPKDPCAKVGCKKYLFAGGDWGPTFKEAIVIVDANGYVVHAEVRQE